MIPFSFHNMKTYGELMKEALEKIPQYTEEWTNFNQSDPGITILENFAAFHLLQQESIRQASGEAKRTLLKLMGIEAGENRASKVYLAPVGSAVEETRLPSHRRMKAGDLVFETTKACTVEKKRLRAIYAENGEGREDLSWLLEGSLPKPAALFGEKADKGASLTLVFDGKFPDSGELALYFRILPEAKRTPFSPGQIPPFAAVRWQYRGGGGEWEDLEALDGTSCFLADGRVLFRRKRREGEGNGFTVRCLLTESKYDIPPKITAIYENPLEVSQRRTLAARFSGGGDRILLESELADYGFYLVLCREPGEPFYRRYEEARAEAAVGRFYRVNRRRQGRIELIFDREKYDFGPDMGEDGIQVICYTEETVHRRFLGVVYGYEGQMIDLGQFGGWVREGFCILVESENESGETLYRIHDCSGTGPGLKIELLEDQNAIRVTEAMGGSRSRLYLCSCAVTEGAAGNVREGVRVSGPEKEGRSETPEFITISRGKGGLSRETIKELEDRMALEVELPGTAVKAEDYERLVQNVPGLCIDQSKAEVDERTNTVRIAVKPALSDRHIGLPPIYRSVIMEHLESHRPVTYRIELRPPRMIPVHVRGKIMVRSNPSDSRQEITAALRKALEEEKPRSGLGAVLCLEELCRVLMDLECVERVEQLYIKPAGNCLCLEPGSEYQMDFDCLCRLGNVSLDLSVRF